MVLLASVEALRRTFAQPRSAGKAIWPIIMATSNYLTTQYTSKQFVESCGAILFDLSAQPKTVCLIHHHAKDEWMLAKGRRNCGESRHEAALREACEETGHSVRLYPVAMATRAPPPDEQGLVPDEPRLYSNLIEPFMMTMRELSAENGKEIKIIWWYIAELDGTGVAGSGGEEHFASEFFPLDEAVQKLTFQNDRSVLQRAIALVDSSYPASWL